MDVATFFSSTLKAVSGSPAASVRVPFSFTSTKRLLGNDNTADRKVAAADSAAAIRQDLDLLEKQVSSSRSYFMPTQLESVYNSFKNNNKGSGVVPVISMMVNPHTVKWNQNKRYVKRDTLTGSTFFHFSDTNGQNNDILTMTFSGNTGNIRTDGVNSLSKISSAISEGTNNVEKLRMWHELYNISREAVLLEGGIKNNFYVTYSTVLMPIPITLVGFYSTPLDFSETAAAPFSREYSFSFTVTSTSPGLDELVSKINIALG